MSESNFFETVGRAVIEAVCAHYKMRAFEQKTIDLAEAHLNGEITLDERDEKMAQFLEAMEFIFYNSRSTANDLANTASDISQHIKVYDNIREMIK